MVVDAMNFRVQVLDRSGEFSVCHRTRLDDQAGAIASGPKGVAR